MAKIPLLEYLSPNIVNPSTLLEDSNDGGKNLYLKGITIQGGIKNANGRIYPTHEIRKAVQTLKEQIRVNNGISGEIDHPDDLKINVDRISHLIVDMWMEGDNGLGKLKIIPTPAGQIVKTLIENGVKLGVSSRGSGDVDALTGQVSDFEIVTIDIVCTPSAPEAYPRPIYESLMNMKYGNKLWNIAKESSQDPAAQRYLREQIVHMIRGLKL